MSQPTEIRLTELDAARLERTLIAQFGREDAASQELAELEAILDQAAVVPSTAIDAQVVTMNSTVVIEDRPGGTRRSLTLVYPKDADPERSLVSVLSPVGRALIGVRVGDLVDVVVPGNPPRRLLVAELTYQPEANGRFDL